MAARLAVVGRPIAHSRSPQLHLAAYAALGLAGWSYERMDCDAEGLPRWVASLGPDWVGLSVTMPAKLAALELADTATARAQAVGAANTLVRTPAGWHADCTDVDGITGALAELGVGESELAGRRVVLLGAGGTARAAVVALADLGVREVDVAVREPARAEAAVACAQRAGLHCAVLGVAGPELGTACAAAAVTISTLPAAASPLVAPAVARCAAVLDVVYDPWPTPIADAARAAGGTVVGGLTVLLHQAYRQVELFTGLAAPREVMAAALHPSAR